MPGTQEIAALGIVALVVGLVVWRRWSRSKAGQRAGSCGDCASATPPQKDATVHFYRRRGPGSPEDDG